MPRKYPSYLTIEIDSGGTFGPLGRPLGDGDSMDIELLNELRPSSFEICPICLGGPATEEEDLPPVSLGGSVMTHTCQPCNNTLGTRLERDLSHWFHGVLPHAQFTFPGVNGARNGGEVVVMSSPEGAPVLVLKGNHHPDVDDWIEAGRDVALEWSPPDTKLVYLALLKQFYLAVCLRFGIPNGPFGAQARHDLLAARDAPSRDEIPISALALALPVGKGQPIAGAPAVAEAVEHHPDGDRLGVVLAGSIFIPWVFTPVALAPIADRQVKVPIRFGSGMSAGTISNVELSPRRAPYPEGRHD